MVELFDAFVDAIIRAKPSGSKGKYLRKISVSSSMGPGLKVDVVRLEGRTPLIFLEIPASGSETGDDTVLLYCQSGRRSGMALDTGWSRLEGERLVSSLHYADNRVTFNGREMSVQEFIGFAFGSAQNAGLLGQ